MHMNTPTPKRTPRLSAIALLSVTATLTPFTLFGISATAVPDDVTASGLPAQVSETAEAPAAPMSSPQVAHPVTSVAASPRETTPFTADEQRHEAERLDVVTPMSVLRSADVTYLEHDSNGATLRVQRDTNAGDKLHVTGSGWTNAAKTASTIAVKVNYLDADGSTRQYRRGTADTGKPGDNNDVFTHPGNGTKDATIYALFTTDAQGNFDTEIVMPTTLKAGQSLTLNFASGLVDGDTQRSVLTQRLIVGGVEYQPPATEKITCTPSQSPPTAEVKNRPNPDNTLTITGKGFCNENSGGAKVAIKIDEGKVERLNTDIADNQTIWAIVQADPNTGDFTFNMPLPDGTTTLPNGSKAPFGTGEHTIRVLSGSLQDGDVRVTLPRSGHKLSFVIGDYAPSGVPDPLHYTENLTDAVKGNVSVTQTPQGKARITVPGRKEGDWVFLSTYIQDGSPRYPWRDTWFRLDKDGSVEVDTSNQIPAGMLKLVVMDGNEGHTGTLLGWTYWTFRTQTTTTTSTTSAAASSTSAAPQGLGHVANGLAQVDKSIVELDKFVRSQKQTTEPTPLDEAEESTTTSRTERTRTRRAPRVSASRPVTRAAGAQPRVQRAVAAGPTYQAKPTNDPKAPVKNRDLLDETNAFDSTGSLKDEQLRMRLPKSKVGDWVFLYVYSSDTSVDPVPAGWVQLDKKREVKLDVADLPNGEYTVAATSPAGEVAGWLDLVLGPKKTFAPAPAVAKEEPVAVMPVAQTQLMSPVDWLLIALGVAIPALTAGGISIIRRRAS